MRFHADLHIHSKYSRATSRDLDLEHLTAWAARKGIGVVGTGDFTHPAWRAELKDKLVPAEPGLFRLRDDVARAVAAELPAACQPDVRFMLQVEISTIYKKGDRTRKVHHLIYAPDFETADRFSERLGRIGNITSDGRPILGLDSRHLLEIALESGPGAYLIPAHIWTPWFAVLGSMSGFDTITDCYGDLSDQIFAVETGLSSDPPMNWRLSMLDRYRLVSNSDAHSPGKLGREATRFDTDRDYYAIRRALETGAGFVGTVEFFPEEGKYHLDGHRKCGMRLTPAETLAHDALCPVCRAPLTVGVLHRAEKLADRPDGCAPPATAGTVSNLVPLPEVLSELADSGPASKTVSRCYDRLVSTLGPELDILDAVPLEDIARAESSLLAEAISRLRTGQVIRESGYDGEYGVIRLFDERELKRLTSGGSALFDTSAPKKAAKKPPPAATGSASAAATTTGATASNSAGAAHTADTASTMNATSAAHVAHAAKAADGILTGLDPDQRRAAETTSGPLLMIAGPGSGKTRTVTHRIAHLVSERGVPATACLAITFTRRAAGEMRERLAHLLPARADVTPTPTATTAHSPQAAPPASVGDTGINATGVAIHTFHSLGLEILREQHALAGLPPGFRIASDAERLDALRDSLAISERKAQSLLRAISKAKRTSVPMDNRTPGADVPSAAHPGSLASATTTAAAAAAAAEAAETSTAAADTSAEATARATLETTATAAATVKADAESPHAPDAPYAIAQTDDGTSAGDRGREREIAAAAATYQRALDARGWLDFDDLICRPVRLLEAQPALVSHYRERFRWISVDEFQDVDELQYRLLTLLAPPDGNLCVIGDPNQAIYGFRGADATCFERFARDFPAAATVALTRNYRSTGTIVTASSQIIATAASEASSTAPSADDRERPRQVIAQVVRGMQERISIQVAPTDRAEADLVVQTIERLMGGHSLLAIDRGRADHTPGTALGFADFAVLFRTSAQADLLVDAFVRSGIPFKKHAHDPIASQPAVRALRQALEQVWIDRPDATLADQIRTATEIAAAAATAAAATAAAATATAAAAAPSTPSVPRSVSATAKDADGETNRTALEIAARETASQRLLALAASCGEDRARFTDALALAAEADFWDPRADRVSLLTLHASKGLEFPVVFIVGLEDGLLPFAWDDLDPAAAAEERRIFYVGMTRAKDRLVLTRAQQRLWRGRVRTLDASPFLGDIEQELVKHHKTAPARKKPENPQLRLL